MVVQPITIIVRQGRSRAYGEEIQGNAGEEIDAEELLEGRGHEGHEGEGGVQGRVGYPAVEWHGAGLGDGADHDEDEGEGAEAARLDVDVGHRRGGGDADEEYDADHHAEIGYARDDEGLDCRLGRALATADRDHAVEDEKEALPEDQEEDEVVGEHGPVHHA
jgi:hypothetical protein